MALFSGLWIGALLLAHLSDTSGHRNFIKSESAAAV